MADRIYAHFNRVRQQHGMPTYEEIHSQKDTITMANNKKLTDFPNANEHCYQTYSSIFVLDAYCRNNKSAHDYLNSDFQALKKECKLSNEKHLEVANSQQELLERMEHQQKMMEERIANLEETVKKLSEISEKTIQTQTNMNNFMTESVRNIPKMIMRIFMLSKFRNEDEDEDFDIDTIQNITQEKVLYTQDFYIPDPQEYDEMMTTDEDRRAYREQEYRKAIEEQKYGPLMEYEETKK